TKEARLVHRARNALTEMGKYPAPAGTNAQDEIRELERALLDVDQVIAARERRQGFIDELKGLTASASARAVQHGRALVARAGLANDPQAQALLRELVNKHVERVKYEQVMKRIEPPAVE